MVEHVVRDDHFHDCCGLIGVFNHSEASTLTYLGLYSLQHRGQESCGIVTSNGKRLFSHVVMGLVAENFNQPLLEQLQGTCAIGHVRYSTTGTSTIKNAQPLVVDSWRGGLGIAHNGNLVNAHKLRKILERKGSIFSSTNDTEVIIHLLARSRSKNLVKALVEVLKEIEGAYALLIITEDRIIGVRDPRGVRPLSIGRQGDTYILASETCSFDLLGAEFVRDVQPGEIVVLNRSGMDTLRPFKQVEPKPCIFEHIYFARPDSNLFGQSVHLVRRKLGQQLCRETHVDADIVIPVPDSGMCAAIGYAEEAKLPFDIGLVRNHYIGRTFIEPQQSIRNFGVKIKLNPVKELVRGKRLILVDDSIVRGTTSRKLVGIFKQAGAKEVHMRVSSPPTRFPCYYGIDTPSQSELIAATHSVDEICSYIEAESLAYLSIDSMLKAVNTDSSMYCTACFSGNYSIDLPGDKRGQLRFFEESMFEEYKTHEKID